MRAPRLGWRIFVTCWLIFSLHFASNTVRELYPALSLGDHFSLRVDEYANLHPDLFEKPGYGWHINSNPGASMLAAIPYALVRPVVDRVVAGANLSRAAKGIDQAPVYDSPWPMARAFYQQAWLRGLDLKFGLGALVSQSLCMAPLSALIVVLMFSLLKQLPATQRAALPLALLFAFGTPLFYRTGTLNHNLLLGHFAFAGFVVLWNPSAWVKWSDTQRALAAGVAAGSGILMDYSGVVPAVTLGLYMLHKMRSAQAAFQFALGALGPLSLLWLAQWQSFGHPFYPAQHWMPAVAFSDQGYHGVALPKLDLLWQNGFDYRFGLFTSAPILLLALAAPWLRRQRIASRLEAPELVFIFASVAGLWLFASAVQFGRLQFNTGVRYMAPAFALLFVPAALALMQLSPMPRGLLAAAAVTQAWCMAMYRDVERGLGLGEPVLQVFTGGLQLPFLTVLSRMSAQYGSFFQQPALPLLIFLFTAAFLYAMIWRPYLRASHEPGNVLEN